MSRFTIRKQFLSSMVLASALALASLPTNAHALGFPYGDVALVVYGGSLEYYRDLGSASALLAPNANSTFTISPTDLAAISSGIPSGFTLRYTVLALDSTANNFLFGSSVANPSSLQINNSFFDLAGDNFGNWSALLAANTGGDAANNPSLVGAQPYSFTQMLGIEGRISGTLGFPAQQLIGTGLTIHSGNAFTGALTPGIGTALLTTDGTLFIGNPAVVPLPTALVLFGTGLIGLIGATRRAATRRRTA